MKRSLGWASVACLGVVVLVRVAQAQEGEGAEGWGDLSELQEEAPIFDVKVYGYIDSYWEKVLETPAGVNEQGETIYEKNPYEFDIPNLHLMVQGTIHGKYRFFLNTAAPGSGSPLSDEALSVRNAWVEAPLLPGYLSLRVGKTYRRFGLYNEILDAVPTFIGIEPPELFDKDHLLLTRTTNLMLLGSAALGESATLVYSVTTGNDEHGADGLPVGLDVHVLLGTSLTLGTSFYTTDGDASPSRGMGEGPPAGGVLNWMKEDHYMVYGGYTQFSWDGLLVQGEFWRAPHDAIYDEASVLALADANLNPRQRARFFAGGDPANGLARSSVKYDVTAAYVRVGQELLFDSGWALTPYLQFDYYDNQETIAEKDFGGDNEAGLSDDGHFRKYTAGFVLRPVPQVAFKADASAHEQKFNGKTEIYPEFRMSLSYLWQLGN
jgi:hypothetical protein